VARAASVVAFEVGEQASVAAEQARSYDAATLQGFDVIRDPSLDHSIARCSGGVPIAVEIAVRLPVIR
jgi:hypothetical protein